jgi:glycosyltransferase involved in cell wall biosynthesis
MTPHIKDIIAMHSIDLLITADSGYTQYPFNTISEIPIIMVNIFGSPTLQKNITPSLFISEAVRKHSEKYVGTKKEDRVVYLSTPAPPEKAKERGKEIRKSFGIKDDDFVLGRIGRNADAIFDPIGIRAFQKIVPQDATIHYIIMSPPPILEKIVKEEGIPNVHFIPPNGDELAIWGFHYAIDCLAHFRYDGETYGMNITESMSVGNPIISHKSTIWNAHSEYLTPGFARIAEIGDTLSYASFIKEYKEIYTHDRITWEAMRKEARRVADNLFSEKAYTISIKEIITQSLSSPL